MTPSDSVDLEPPLIECIILRNAHVTRKSFASVFKYWGSFFVHRSYSLENVAEEKYGGSDSPHVTLLPTNRLSRADVYNDASLNRRASREELDKVVPTQCFLLIIIFSGVLSLFLIQDVSGNSSP